MAFKRRKLARKDRREDLREAPKQYREEHRADLLRVDRSSRRTDFLPRLLGCVYVILLGAALIKAIEFVTSHQPLENIGVGTLVILVSVSIFRKRLRDYFSKVLKHRTPREQPAPHEGPRSAQVLLLFVSKRNREHIIGDMEEEYRTTNKRFPRLWYWGQVLTLVASYWWATLRRRLGFDVVLKMIRK